jgi:hypothetical protein
MKQYQMSRKRYEERKFKAAIWNIKRWMQIVSNFHDTEVLLGIYSMALGACEYRENGVWAQSN